MLEGALSEKLFSDLDSLSGNVLVPLLSVDAGTLMELPIFDALSIKVFNFISVSINICLINL